VWEVRAVALLLAAGVAGALDDPTRATVAAVPTPLRFRYGVRLLLLVPPVAVSWSVLVWWVDARVGGALPALALTLEAAAVTGVVLAVCAVLARWPGLPDPGVAAGPLLAAFAFGVPVLPRWTALAVLPGPGWDAAHLRWAVLLLAALTAFAVAVRDPAARLTAR
jgi:fluoroquinolone transport system permease protein